MITQSVLVGCGPPVNVDVNDAVNVDVNDAVNVDLNVDAAKEAIVSLC